MNKEDEKKLLDDELRKNPGISGGNNPQMQTQTFSKEIDLIQLLNEKE